MKNKLKGFTLVELIVVSALISILMLAMVKMFQPIRQTYVDTTQFAAQRTAQNGIVQYITESVRYSTDLGVYDSVKGVSSASGAVSLFATEYCKNAGLVNQTTGAAISPYTTSDVALVTAEIQKYAEVIIIDNSTTHYSKSFTGRLIRRKVDMNPASASAVAGNPAFVYVSASNARGAAKVLDTASAAKWRVAMGEAYYGENTYYINVSFNDTDGDSKPDGKDGLLKVSVASTRNGKREITNAGNETTATGTVGTTESGQVTRGGVLCRNLIDAASNGVDKKGVIDISKYSGSSVTNGSTTYIVFLNNNASNKEKDKVEAVVKTVKASHVTP